MITKALLRRCFSTQPLNGLVSAALIMLILYAIQKVGFIGMGNMGINMA